MRDIAPTCGPLPCARIRLTRASPLAAQVDEAMLYRGAAFYAQLALDYLDGKSGM